MANAATEATSTIMIINNILIILLIISPHNT